MDGASPDPTLATAKSAPQSPDIPDVPDHELLRRIGGGSYGEVWMARTAVGTLRAVKVVHRCTFERDEHFEREFKGMQKFEPISRSHDGLVDILQIGRNDQAGYFYYVMELADSVSSIQPSVFSKQSSEVVQASGRAPPLNTGLLITEYSPNTLRSDIRRRGPLPVSECVTIGLKLASALEHLPMALNQIKLLKQARNYSGPFRREEPGVTGRKSWNWQMCDRIMAKNFTRSRLSICILKRRTLR
jgi:hypothetical protein